MGGLSVDVAMSHHDSEMRPPNDAIAEVCVAAATLWATELGRGLRPNAMAGAALIGACGPVRDTLRHARNFAPVYALN